MIRLRNMYAWTSEVDGINKWKRTHQSTSEATITAFKPQGMEV